MLADVRSLAKAEVSNVALASRGPARQQRRSAVDPRAAAARAEPRAAERDRRDVDSADEIDLLRRLAYGLGSGVIRSMRIALTEVGAFVLRERGVELLPLGSFFRRLHPRIYVPSGFDVAPLVDPNVLFGALGSPADKIVFLMADSRVLALDDSAFVPLDSALLAPEPLTALPASELAELLETEIPTLWLEPLGLAPLRGAEPAR